MAEGHGAAMHVDAREIDAQLAADRHGLHREPSLILIHAAEGAPRGRACGLRRQAAAQVLVGEQVEMRLISSRSSASRRRRPASPRNRDTNTRSRSPILKTLKPSHSQILDFTDHQVGSSSRRLTIATVRAQLSAPAASCFRPARVIE